MTPAGIVRCLAEAVSYRAACAAAGKRNFIAPSPLIFFHLHPPFVVATSTGRFQNAAGRRSLPSTHSAYLLRPASAPPRGLFVARLFEFGTGDHLFARALCAHGLKQCLGGVANLALHRLVLVEGFVARRIGFEIAYVAVELGIGASP